MEGLKVLEHERQRILLTSQLAEGYGATARNISENFNNHKERFIEGKHYHLLQGESLKLFKSEYDNIVVAPNVNKLYLWTEKGALRHAKILDTNKAWEVYEELEDTYFKVKEQLPSSIEDLIILQAESVKELKGEVVSTNKRMDKLADKVDNQITLEHPKQRVIQASVNQRIVSLLGGKLTEEYKAFSKKYFSAIHKDIKDRFGVTSYKDIKLKDYQNACNYIQNWIAPVNILM